MSLEVKKNLLPNGKNGLVGSVPAGTLGAAGERGFPPLRLGGVAAGGLARTQPQSLPRLPHLLRQGCSGRFSASCAFVVFRSGRKNGEGVRCPVSSDLTPSPAVRAAGCAGRGSFGILTRTFPAWEKHLSRTTGRLTTPRPFSPCAAGREERVRQPERKPNGYSQTSEADRKDRRPL